MDRTVLVLATVILGAYALVMGVCALVSLVGTVRPTGRRVEVLVSHTLLIGALACVPLVLVARTSGPGS